MSTKICPKCKEEKSFSKFRKANKGKYLLQSYCNSCKKDYQSTYMENNKEKCKNYHKVWYSNHKEQEIKRSRKKELKRKFNITLEEYTEKLIKQDFKCKICGTDRKFLKRGLAVDHCHKTNKIRDLLCGKCNRGLGYFNENIEIFQKAINYLTNHAES